MASGRKRYRESDPEPLPANHPSSLDGLLPVSIVGMATLGLLNFEKEGEQASATTQELGTGCCFLQRELR